MTVNIYGTVYSIPDWVLMIITLVALWLLFTYRKSIEAFIPEALSWVLILAIVTAAAWYFMPGAISRISNLW